MGISQVSDAANNVTRQQTVPEDLLASEIRYRRLFESARDGILILDAASRRITDVNPFMVEFLGYSQALRMDGTRSSGSPDHGVDNAGSNDRTGS
jgi:PAS domain-containing protein